MSKRAGVGTLVVIALVLCGGVASAQSRATRIPELGRSLQLPSGWTYLPGNKTQPGLLHYPPNINVSVDIEPADVKSCASLAAEVTRNGGRTADVAGQVPTGWFGKAMFLPSNDPTDSTELMALCLEKAGHVIGVQLLARKIGPELRALLSAVSTAFSAPASGTAPPSPSPAPAPASGTVMVPELGRSITLPADWQLVQLRGHGTVFRNRAADIIELSRRAANGRDCASVVHADPVMMPVVSVAGHVPPGWYDEVTQVPSEDMYTEDTITVCRQEGSAIILARYQGIDIDRGTFAVLSAISSTYKGPVAASSSQTRHDGTLLIPAIGTPIKAPDWSTYPSPSGPDYVRHRLGYRVGFDRSGGTCSEQLRSRIHYNAAIDIGDSVPPRWRHGDAAIIHGHRIVICLQAAKGIIVAFLETSDEQGLPQIRELLRAVSAVVPPPPVERAAAPVKRVPRYGDRAPVEHDRSQPRVSAVAPRPAYTETHYRRDLFETSYPRRRRKAPVNTILAGGSFIGLVGMGSAIGIGADSSDVKTIVGAFAGTTLVIAALRRAVQHHNEPLRHHPKAGAFLGDDGWFRSASSQLGFMVGTATQSVTDPASGMDTADRMNLVGAQWVMRGSFVRASMSSALTFGGASDRSFTGLDFGAGIGVQLFRGGLFSPYSEVRYSFMPNTIANDSALAGMAGGADGVEFVVGNTFMFSPLGYRGYSAKGQGTLLVAQPNASRFYVDVSYVASGRGLFGNRLMVTLGFDHAWWR